MELLKKGSKGDDVATMQLLLKQNGFDVEIDGNFGLKTENEIKLFQLKTGLDNDGIVGNMTWIALNGVPGIWNHSNVRIDKTDCSPQRILIDMLNTL